MRPRRRRRGGSAARGRTYSLAYLLNRQPKTLAKEQGYSAMIAHYHASQRLQSLRITRRCYTLLHNARITPENLHHFYRTYRLPADPFFPLFFSVKRAYLARREQIREERRRSIRGAMRSLPPEILGQIKYLGYLERHYHPAGLSPVWQQHLYPGSKRRANAYSRYDTAAWLALFRAHLNRMRERYRDLSEVTTERVFACFVLGIVPATIPPQRPVAADIARLYRRLSLLHHPDRGGDPTVFIAIKRARDVLVERSPSG